MSVKSVGLRGGGHPEERNVVSLRVATWRRLMAELSIYFVLLGERDATGLRKEGRKG